VLSFYSHFYFYFLVFFMWFHFSFSLLFAFFFFKYNKINKHIQNKALQCIINGKLKGTHLRLCYDKLSTRKKIGVWRNKSKFYFLFLHFRSWLFLWVCRPQEVYTLPNFSTYQKDLNLDPSPIQKAQLTGCTGPSGFRKVQCKIWPREGPKNTLRQTSRFFTWH
jgi:hypothetical protein